jgi:integrase
MDTPHNRPQKGESIKVEPIRQKAAIERIKAVLLKNAQYRDHCLFTLGINTAFRANELLSLKIGQVLHLAAGDILELKQSKNRKHRAVTLNKTAAEALRLYIERDMTLQKRMADKDAPLFYSQRGDCLTVPSVHNMVKAWCAHAGLKGNYGSHTMRKTWGYWQYKRGKPLPLLMEAYGHATQKQTLAYLCIQAEDVQQIYDLEL